MAPGQQTLERTQLSDVKVLLAGVSSAAILFSGAGAAFAADATPAPAAAQTVDAIVVTAQKRSQSLQDVPVVVNVATAQLLQDSGVHDIKDLTLLTPGLIVTSTSSESITTARIRGIGTVGDNIGLESSVGVVIDGVYRPRNGVSFGDLGDLDRIEVLKGPQGTLFGKSTSAGVINVVSKQPSFNFGTSAEFTAGNYGAVGGSASVTGPIIQDKLAGEFYVSDRQRDGYYTVKTGAGPRTASDDQTQNFYTVRGQLLYTPVESFDAKVIMDYSHRDERCCVGVQTQLGATAGIVSALTGGGGIAPTANPFNRVAYANQNTSQNIIDTGVSLEAHWSPEALKGATLTSITAYRDWKRLGGSDTDYTGADILTYPITKANEDEFKTFSQELRLAGKTDKLNWLIGGFYANEDLQHNAALRYGSQFKPYISLLFTGGANPGFLNSISPTGYLGGAGDTDVYHQVDRTYALFTNESYKVTDKLELTAGLRYTIDDKNLNSRTLNTDGGVGCGTTLATAAYVYGTTGTQPFAAALPVLCLPFESPGFNNYANHQSQSEKEWAGTLKASYRFNPEVLSYVSYARGYKAGGFNLDRIGCPNAPGCPTLPTAANYLAPVNDTSFKGEFVDSYEAGLKSTLLDRKLLLNGTLFYQTFTNFQLNTFTGLVFVVDSIPVVHSQGLDTDFVWFAAKDLSIQGGVTYADTRYTHADQTALVASGFKGAAGSRMSLAPLWSASTSATYTYHVNDTYDLRFNAGAKYSSKYNTGSDEDAAKVQKAFTLVNARIGFGPHDKSWSVEAWAENLFDQNYYQVVFNGPFQPGTYDAFLGAPATYGVTLRARY